MRRTPAKAATTSLTVAGILWSALACGGVSCADAVPVESMSWEGKYGETVTFKGLVTKASPRSEDPEGWPQVSNASVRVGNVRVVIADRGIPDLWRYDAADSTSARLRSAVVGKTACVEGTYWGKPILESGDYHVVAHLSRIKFVDNATPVESP